jgi:hypothetical protein
MRREGRDLVPERQIAGQSIRHLAHQAHPLGAHPKADRQEEQVADQVVLDGCSGDIGDAGGISVSTQVVGMGRRYPDLGIAGGS